MIQKPPHRTVLYSKQVTVHTRALNGWNYTCTCTLRTVVSRHGADKLGLGCRYESPKLNPNMHQKDVKYKINFSKTEIWTSFAKTCFEFGFACTPSVPNTKLTGLTSFMFKQHQRVNTANTNICNEPKFVLTGLYRSYDQIHFRANTRATF